jgi:drug/metabolite transporter (DMT)-like permease
LSESQDAAAGFIGFAGIVGAVICLFVAFILGVGGISGTKVPVFATLLAVGSIMLPVLALVVLRGEPSTQRRIIAVTLGITPLVFISLLLFRAFFG